MCFFCLQVGEHTNKKVWNIQFKSNLRDHTKNLFGWLETSLIILRWKSVKITLQGNWQYSVPKQEHRSAMWHMKDRDIPIFFQKGFFYSKSCLTTFLYVSKQKKLFLGKKMFFLFFSCYTALYMLDFFFGFWRLFGLFLFTNYLVTSKWNEWRRTQETRII